MIKRLEFLRKHWDYYLMLEERFISTIRYIDWDDNMSNMLKKFGIEPIVEE